MTPAQWKRAREIFQHAIALEPAEADEYVGTECASEPELLSDLRSMLVEHRRGGALERHPVYAPGDVINDRYRIVRYINRGGMGEVYEAEHLLLRRSVALKILLPAIADEAAIARFMQEIQLAQRISSDYVCKIFDIDREQEQEAIAPVFYLTMEFLRGETLSRRLERQGRMSAAEALPLIEQMAEALDAAHRAGVIHCDFKTSNVMLVPEGAGERAVVTDFGLARAIPREDDSTASLSRHLAGTLDYMAPELFTGSVASVRTDLYALGMVAYKMVTGVLPSAKKPAPSPRVAVPDLDPNWDHAIQRALDPDPGRRYSEVLEFPKALRGEPVSVTGRLSRVQRNRLVAGACVMAVLAIVAVGWNIWSGIRNRLSPEALRFYQQGVEDIHAGAYFAATKALGQTVQLASYSPARARLAESWYELDLPETAAREFLTLRRQSNASLSKLDRLQIDAVDLTITREFAGAVAKYEQMRKLAGDAAGDLDIDLGRAYEKAGKPDNAIEAYTRAAKGPTHSAAAWLRLGVLYGRRNKFAESEAAFAQAEQGYRQISNLEGLTELTLQRGVAANRAGRYADASTLLGKAMDLAHDAGNLQQEISAKLTLANVACRAGDSDQAQKLAGDALATAQANQMEALTIRGLINLGASFLAKGDPGAAAQHFQNALALAERTNSKRLAAQSSLNLASAYDRLRRSDEEIRAASDALAYFEPAHWVQERFSALLLIARGEQYRGNFDAAGKSFQQLLEESQKAEDQGNMAQAHEGLGGVLTQREKYPQALAHYQEFLKLNPESVYALMSTAITLARLGRFEEASNLFAKAETIGTSPEVRAALARYRAETALMRKRPAEAISIVRSGMAGGDNLNPLVKAHLVRLLGLAQLRSGDRKAGLINCQAAFDTISKLDGAGELVDSRVSLIEALQSAHEPARAEAVFHEMEPRLNEYPEQRWRALALMARGGGPYLERAREALAQLNSIWGREPYLQYLTRPDLQDLERPLFAGNSAIPR